MVRESGNKLVAGETRGMPGVVEELMDPVQLVGRLSKEGAQELSLIEGKDKQGYGSERQG